MTKRVGATWRVHGLRAMAVFLMVGCGETTPGVESGGGGARTTPDGGASVPPDSGPQRDVSPPSNIAAYTVSYRNQVRVPASGAVLSYNDFATQVSRLDPLAAKRCPVSHDAEFQVVVDALGGINWTHPVEILKDRSLPPLYTGRIVPVQYPPSVNTAGAVDSSASAAPVIERPDLVGYQDHVAIFLSQRHGLLAVKTDTAKPELSCALKLPGRPKYFFYHGKELVLLVNGMAANQAALLRFAINGPGFDFLDAIRLDNQQIQDARLFDSTLVVYSTLFSPPATTTTTPVDTGSGATPVAVPVVRSGSAVGMKVTAVKWGATLALAWEEELPNDPVVSDPLANRDPDTAVKELTVGQVVASYKSYKPFISASDRYFVVSRDVSKTVFTGTRSRSYSVCTASHPGPDRTVKYCHPQYERRPNPDYREPETKNGDYPCNGKKLLDCIQEAAPLISKYIHVRVGQTCTEYTTHDTICDARETRTVSYPTYRTDRSTQFMVYRYTDGDFVKLDEQLYQMAAPGTVVGTVAQLTFTPSPLEVTGTIDHKGDLQFQRGHFYVLTDKGQVLHTLLIAGNSIAELGKQDVPRQGGSFSYNGTHSTLFSDTRMMVSRAYYDSKAPQGIYNWSDVLMMDLSAASFPTAVNHFTMPGSSDQLILADDGILGPGTVRFTSGGVQRNLQKLTLFARDDAAEVDNLLLGTEFNANFVQTWLGTGDDQRIRLDGLSQRLFLPYSGYDHAPDTRFNPATHRLNITAVGVGTGLLSEATFDLVEAIVRTVSFESSLTPVRALAFGDSSIYALTQGPQGWSVEVVEEYATPIAVYRLSDDADLHARVDRIGARCTIATFSGGLQAFAPTPLAQGPYIDCPEGGSPTGIGQDVVFANASSGWRLSADGRTITALDADAVAEALTRVRNDDYCVLDATSTVATPVPYLDAVPPSIECFPRPTYTGGGNLAVGAMPTTGTMD